MPRGGYRPGAGRKPGAKDKKPRKKAQSRSKPVKTEEKPKSDREKIRGMLVQGMRAKATIYREFLERVATGEKLSITEKKMMAKLEAELSAEVGEEKEQPKGIDEAAGLADMTPLEYMLQVMRDPEADPAARRAMAVAAAPLVHAKLGEKGKKQDKEDRAKRAGSGKFAPSAPPLKVVK